MASEAASQAMPPVAKQKGGGRSRRRRDVARALGAFLLVARGRDQVAGVLLRAADVDERLRLLADLLPDGVAVRPNRLVALAGRVLGLLRLRCLGRELAALVRPLLPAAVDDAHIFVAVDLQV